MATFYFNCPHCGNLLSGEDEWRGMATQCPYCQKAIIIPIRTFTPSPTKYRKNFLSTKIKLISGSIIAVLLVVLTILYFATRSTSTFLIEEIIGVNIGQSVTNKNSDGNLAFSDCFHCFDISEQYKGKIIFEKVSFPASYTDIYLGDGTVVVSSPAAIADSNNNVRWLSIIITDRNLFRDILQDFAKKGFGSGHKGYSSTESFHISDLAQCDFSENKTYSFISEDQQYQLSVSTGKITGLLNYKEDISCARVILCGKIPEDSQKGIRLLTDSNDFLNTSLIRGAQETSILAHPIIHYKEKSSSCTHIDGFSQK